MCGRRLEPLSETAALADGGRCEALSCDIREEDQVGALVDEVLGRHGRIDLLVNNAGGQYLTPAEDITPKGFSTVMRLNVEGTWLMTHAVATRAMMGDEGERRRAAAGRQDRQRHALAPPRPARDGPLLGGTSGGREPHPRPLDRVGAIRDTADGGGGGATSPPRR